MASQENATSPNFHRTYYERVAAEFDRVAEIVRHRTGSDREMAEHLHDLAINIRQDSGLYETHKMHEAVWLIRLRQPKQP